mgnify:CR=1 FL=1
MREIAFKKVSRVMNTSPLLFSSTDTISEFIGSICQSGSREAVVVFKNRLGLVTVMEVLDALHPERTLLGRVARRVSPINKDSTVLEAVDSMISNNIRALPVVEGEEVIGVISCAEVVNAMKSSPDFKEIKCEEVMKSTEVSVNEDDKVSTARSIMYEHGTSSLPVINRWRQLKGIVTARDIVFAFVQPEGGVTRGEVIGESSRVWDLPVKEIMDVDLLTVKGSDTLADLAREFEEFGKEVCVVKRYKGAFYIVTPMEMITPLLDYEIKELVHVRILGLPEFGDFLHVSTVQDKVVRVLRKSFTFRSDIREVIIDVKLRKRLGKRIFYQVEANVHSLTKPPLNVSAQGWYLAEVFDNLCRKLDRSLRKSKKRKTKYRNR